MHRICQEADCDRPSWKEHRYCGEHTRAYNLRVHGPCKNHPDRPVHVKREQLCSSCYKVAWRKRLLITDDAHPRNATPEVSDFIAYIAREVRPVRSRLARYLRCLTVEAERDVYFAYHLLIMASSCLTDGHWRFLLSEINQGATEGRIPDQRRRHHAEGTEQAAAYSSQSAQAAAA